MNRHTHNGATSNVVPGDAGSPPGPAWHQLGNFEARIVRDSHCRDGSPTEGKVVFELEVRVNGGPPRQGPISAGDFQQDQALKRRLGELGRSGILISGRIDAIRAAIVVASAAAEETIYNHTGWVDLGDQSHFLMPGFSLGPTQPQVELPLQERGISAYGFTSLTDAEFRTALTVFGGDFLRAMPPHIAYPCVAAAFGAVIHRFLGTEQKYLLWLLGQTGTFKTTWGLLLMTLWGEHFAQGVPTASWGSTVNAIEHAGHAVPDCLFLIDDFKPAMVSSSQVTRVIQNYADGMGRGRLSGAAELQATKWIRGHLVATGEDLPEGEASVRARLLIVPVEPGVARLEHVNAARAQARLLAGVLPRFITWVMADLTVGVKARQLYETLRRGYESDPSLKGVLNRARLAQNVAMNAVGFEALVAWLLEENALTPLQGADMRQEYVVIARDLLAQMAKKVRTERASERFIEELNGLLATGRYVIAGGAKAPREPGTTELGWRDVDKDMVYINPTSALHEINRVSSLHVTPQNLYRQLAADGMLAQRYRDQHTVPRRRLDRAQRVLALHAKLFGLGGDAWREEDGFSVVEFPLPMQEREDEGSAA